MIVQKLILAVLCLLMPFSAQAFEGVQSNLSLIADSSQEVRVEVEYDVKWRLDTLMGEPTRNLVLRWRLPENTYIDGPGVWDALGDPKDFFLNDFPKEIQDTIRLYDVKITIDLEGHEAGFNCEGHAPVDFPEASVLFDAGVPAKAGEKWSYNVTGSPNWQKFMFDTASGTKPSTEDEAKKVMSSPVLCGRVVDHRVTARINLGDALRWLRSNFNKRPAQELLSGSWEQLGVLRDELGIPVSDLEQELQKLGFELDVAASPDEIKAAGWKIEEFAQNLAAGIRSSNIPADKLEDYQTRREEIARRVEVKLSNLTSYEKSYEAATIAYESWRLQNEASLRERSEQLKAGSQQPAAIGPQSSILFLIDTSGSMDGAKMEAAKEAARENMRASIKSGSEVAILGFAGDCETPLSFSHPFSMDVASLQNFITRIEAGGGTPLATALTHANQFLHDNKAQGSLSQAIVLLADGDGGCGDVDTALSDLALRNILYRHEAVGLGIDSGSAAVQQLNTIAQRSGGGYHYASNPKQLKRAFEDAFENMAISRMLGQFGQEPKTVAAQKPSSLWDQLK